MELLFTSFVAYMIYAYLKNLLCSCLLEFLPVMVGILGRLHYVQNVGGNNIVGNCFVCGLICGYIIDHWKDTVKV